MPVKTLDIDGSGDHAQFSDGFHFAVDNGARIINYSAGGVHSETKAEAVAYARNAGVIIIASMGNTGDTSNTVEYPAAYDDYVIAVGATRFDQTRPSYSSYGSHCDIAAPGGDLTVDQNGDGYGDGVLQQTFAFQEPTNLGYYFLDGTSMAAPHVAGVAALILAKNPSWNPEQVRHAIQSTATDKGTAGRDDEYGWGLMDAYDAVNSSLATTASYSDDAHNTACDNFTDYGTEHTVYMYGTGLLPSHSYKAAYYDGDNDERDTHNVTSGASGNVSSQHTFVEGADVAGTWNVILCEPANDPPSSYDATWSYTITSDDFVVQQSAIPEFPTVITAIVALSLCVGVYLWMRRRTAPVPVKSSTLW